MNVLTTAASGSILFDSGTAGGSTHTHLSAAAELSYDGTGGIDITSHVPGETDRFNVRGAGGTLFSVNDALTGTVFSVNDASGLPIIEVNSNATTDTIAIGEYGTNALFVSGGNVGVGTVTPTAKLDVSTTGADGINLSKDTGTTTISTRLFFSNATAGQGVSIYNSGSNMRFQTGSTVGSSTGTTRMVINSNGRVGIGTASPSSLLHLEDAVSPTLQLKDTTQGTTLKAFSQDSNAHLGTFSNHPLAFDTNSSERMRITSSGNVGIGTDSPAVKLEISDSAAPNLRLRNTTANAGNSGTLEFREADTNYGAFVKYNGDANVFNIGTRSSGTDYNRINISRDTGYVGIGTTAPGTLLEIDQSANTYASGLSLRNAGNVIYGMFVDGSNNLNFHYQGSSKVVFESGGNVGIGTTSAARPLTINSDTSHRAIRILENDSANESWDIGVDVDGDLNFFNSADSSPTVVFSDSGKVGIGTDSPTATLDVKGDGAEIYLKSADHSVARIIPRGTGSNLDKGLLSLFDTGTEDVRIDTAGNSWFNGGNVGIGQGSPTAKLHLKGDGGTTGLTFKTTDFSNNEIFYVFDGGRVGVRYSPFSIGIPSTTSLATNAVFQVEEAGLLTVLSTGKVGIGETAPEVKLEVAGDIMAKDSFVSAGATASLGYTFHDLGTGWGYKGVQSPSRLGMFTSGAERVTINTDGKVGIGCTTPTQKLAVDGDGLFTSNLTVQGSLSVTGAFTCLETTISVTSALSVQNDGTGPALIVNQTGSNDIVDFRDDGTSAFYIEDGGNVGIGITDPTAKLHVDGTGKFNDSLYFANRGVISWGNIGGGTGFGIRGESGNGLSLGSNGVWDKMVITTAGKVGIGTTSPSEKLHVSTGHLRLDTGYSLQWSDSHERIEQSDGHLEFFVNNTESMTLDTNGLGIGTTSPDHKLHVKGDVTIDNESSSVPSMLHFNATNKSNLDPTARINFWEGDAHTGTYTGSHAYIEYNGSTAGGGDGYLAIGGSTDAGANSDIMVINRLGRVGIGAAVPKGKLHVLDGTAGSYTPDSEADTVVIESSVAGGISLIGTGSASVRKQKLVFGTIGDPTGAEVRYDPNNSFMSVGTTAASNYLKLITGNGTEAMRLAADGKVGIGTTSPSNALEISNTSFANQLRVLRPQNTEGGIAGVINIAGTNSASAVKDYARIGVIIDDNTNATEDGSLVLQTITNGTNTEKMRIDSSGDVGIGGTSAGAKLEIHQAQVTTQFDRDPFLRLHPTATTNSGGFTNIMFGTSPVNNFGVAIGGLRAGTDGTPSFSIKMLNDDIAGTEVLRISNDGKIQIGNNIPMWSGSYGGALFLKGNNATSDRYAQLTEVDSTGAATNVGLVVRGSNVGIGTNSPNTKLEIAGGADTIARITATTTSARLDLKTNSHHRFWQTIESDGRFRLYNQTTSAEQLTIKSDGKVGIGTGSTALYNAFTVNGNANLATGDGAFLTFNNGDANITVHYNNADSVVGRDLSFKTYKAGVGNTEKMRIDRDGKVGIGTTSPSEKLDITGGYLKFNGGDYGLKGSASLTYNPVSDHYFQSSGSTKVVFKASGNVGIGTTSPAQKLHVNGNVDIDNGGILLQRGYGVNLGVSGYDLYMPTTTRVAIQTASTERLSILNNGNVGIGTTAPTAPLHIDGGTESEVLKIEADSNPYIRWIQNGTNVGFLQFNGGSAYLSNMANGSLFIRTNNTDKMTITSSGNVGIGTTSPDSFNSEANNLVVGTGSGVNGITINAGTTSSAALMFADGTSGTEAYRGFIQYRHAEDGFRFGTAGGAKMCLDSGGKLGVNTLAPNATLTVAGQLSARSFCASDSLHNSFWGNVPISNITTASTNTAIGYNSLRSLTSGNWNVAIGSHPLEYNTTGRSNIALGYLPLNKNTTGCCNIALGLQALYENTTGSSNIAMGIYSLLDNTTGSCNTGLGYFTLKSNTTGHCNVAIGKEAMLGNTTGGCNVALGPYALRYNTTGVHNYAVGNLSMQCSLSGNHNTAIGQQSLADNYGGCCNAAIGYLALEKNTVGDKNFAVGPETMRCNTTGQKNIALGDAALCKNTTGVNNIAIGSESSRSALSANYNTAIGQQALCSNYGGACNTSIGYISMQCNTTGGSNVAIGPQTMRCNTTGGCNAAIGPLALYHNTTGGCNTAIGYQALYNNTTGYHNTAITQYALAYNTTGTRNTAIGYVAMYRNTTGGYNFAAGSQAMQCNTTGNYNTAIGENALRGAASSSGSYNFAVGQAAMIGITTGAHNTALGYIALCSNTTGASNVGIGINSLCGNTTGSCNVAIGPSALCNNTTGGCNVAIGRLPMVNNTTGHDNVALGHQTLVNNTTGNYNFGSGFLALAHNTEGDQNTAIGYYALHCNTTGTRNIAIGAAPLEKNTTGSYNVALGYRTLNQNTTGSNNVAFGCDTLLCNTTGACNTAIGKLALCTNTTGSFNTAIGNEALLDSTTGSHNTAIGCTALQNNTTGGLNFAVGNNALGSATTASSNIAIGGCALKSTVSSGSNVALGLFALCNTTAVNNIGIGESGGKGITSGIRNLALGQEALGQNAVTTGNNNVAIGFRSLANTCAGNNNTGIGFATLCSNTTGAGNVALGEYALKSNTSGADSVMIGYNAGCGFTTATNNIGIGCQALKGSGTSTGSNNVAIGKCSQYNVSSGTENLAIGAQTLQCNQTGARNVAIGSTSGFRITGSDNLVFGRAAGCGITSGSTNVAIGNYAMRITANNGTSSDNVAIGNQALKTVTSGSKNIALGFCANQNGTTGGCNISIGACAHATGALNGTRNIALGEATMWKTTSGNNNIAMGFVALGCNTTGSCNIAIGYQAGRFTGTGTTQMTSPNNSIFIGNDSTGGGGASSCNEIVLGFGAVGCGNNKAMIGNSSLTHVCSNGTFSTVSDIRDKTCICDLEFGLDFIGNLKPKTFNMITDRSDPEGSISCKRHGFIAQDVLALEGEDSVIVSTDNPNQLGYTGEHIIPILVKGMQEQQAVIDNLTARLEALEG